MSEYVYANTASQTLDIFLQDSSSSTGQGLAGLVYNSAGLVASYRKGATGSRTAITLATQTVGGAFSSGGFVEIDATNMKGVYRLDIPNAAVDTEGFVTLYLYGATNLLPTALRVDCRPLPVDVRKFGGTDGTFASGIPAANTTQFAGQTITAATGVTIPASIASPTNITAGTITTVTTLTGHTPQTGDSFARIGALGAGLTSLAPAATALSTATWTATIAGRIDVAVSTRASQTSVDTIDDLLDTEMPALTAAIATVQSDTNDIQTRLPAALESGRIAAVLDSTATAALVDLIWDEPLTGATHNVAHSSGKRLRQTTAFQQIDSTVIDASATTTTFVTGLTSSVDNFYNDSMLVFTDGALAGQVRAIYDYIGATKTIVLEEALTSAPVNGVAFAVVSLHIHPVSQIQSGLATAAALATESAKLNRIEAVATGTVTGAGTSTEVFVGPSATLTITVDSSGNRSAVVVT